MIAKNRVLVFVSGILLAVNPAGAQDDPPAADPTPDPPPIIIEETPQSDGVDEPPAAEEPTEEVIIVEQPQTDAPPPVPPTVPTPPETPPVPPQTDPVVAPTPPVTPPAQPVPATEPLPTPLPPAQSPVEASAQTPVGEQLTTSEPMWTDSAPVQPQLTDESADDEDHSFSWFSLAPQLGFSFFPEAEHTIYGLPLTVESRKAFVVKAHLDFGGDDVALELIPFAAIETGGDSLSVDLSQSAGSGMGGDYVAVGGQSSIVYRFAIKRFYPHFGIGFHGAYLISDDIKYGAELYGRVPIGFTWYFLGHLGLVFEFNLMYGATGIRGNTEFDLEELKEEYAAEYDIDPEDLENLDMDDLPEIDGEPMSDEKIQNLLEAKIAESIQFGTGFAFEFMIGLRFP